MGRLFHSHGPATSKWAGCLILNVVQISIKDTYARFYQLGITGETRVIPGIRNVLLSVISSWLWCGCCSSSSGCFCSLLQSRLLCQCDNYNSACDAA